MKHGEWQQIQAQEKYDAIFNLGYYDMNAFARARSVQAVNAAASAGLVVDRQVIAAPKWHQYGVCIDANGRASCNTELSAAGKINYCVAQPPIIINGTKSSSAATYGKNGTTMVGFKADETMVVLLCGKDQGMTSADAVSLLKRRGCKDILCYDGSWSTQGCLGPGMTLQPSQRRIVHNYMIGFKKGADTEQPAKKTTA